MGTCPPSWLLQHSMLQPFHATSFQGSPATPMSNCTWISSEASPPSLDFQPRNVTGKMLLEVPLLGWCSLGSPKLPGDLWEMGKNSWKRTDRDQSSLPGQRFPVQGIPSPSLQPHPSQCHGRDHPGWDDPGELLVMVSVTFSRAGCSGILGIHPEASAAPGPCHCPVPWEALPTASPCFFFFPFALYADSKTSKWGGI